jgi:hypothetical protein
MGSIYMANPVPVKYVGKCRPCNRPVVMKFADADNPDRLYASAVNKIPCPDCKSSCDAELMYGAVNKMTCDDRCMGAYGKQCVCGCGGINHGGVWSEVLENIPAHVVEAYYKDQERRKQVAKTKEDNKKSGRNAEFVSWYKDNSEDVEIIRAYTGNNPFILGAQAKVGYQVQEILSPNYLSAVVRVIGEEAARLVKENEKRQAALRSDYQGMPGCTLVRTLTVTDVIHVKDNYAFVPRGSDIPTKPLYKFTDGDGNVYLWFASKYQAKLRKDGTFTVNDVWKTGDVFKVTAKVKKHDEYEGIKQTVVNYVKVV